MTSVTEIHSGCFKTGDLPKDCEVFNMVLGWGLFIWGPLCKGERGFFSLSFCKTELKESSLVKQKMEIGDWMIAEEPKKMSPNSRDAS